MSERPDDDRQQALDQRLASLRKLQLAARIVAVVAALITLGWLVLGISSLSGDLGMGTFWPFVLAGLGALMTAMAVHTGWVIAPRGIRTVSERLERPSDVPDSA